MCGYVALSSGIQRLYEGTTGTATKLAPHTSLVTGVIQGNCNMALQQLIFVVLSETLLMRQLNSMSLQSFLRSSLGLHIMV